VAAVIAARRCRQDGAHQLYTAALIIVPVCIGFNLLTSYSESRRPPGARGLVGAGSGERVVAKALPLWSRRVALAFADLWAPTADARGRGAGSCGERFLPGAKLDPSFYSPAVWRGRCGQISPSVLFRRQPVVIILLGKYTVEATNLTTGIKVEKDYSINGITTQSRV
jgi:hypothetical protein